MHAVDSLFKRSWLWSLGRWLAASAVLIASSTRAWGFDFDSVTAMARTRAQTPYRTAPHPLPSDLAALDYDGMRNIRYQPERRLWNAPNAPFETAFFHLGLYQTEPVLIHEVRQDGVHRVPYRWTDFDYGDNTLKPQMWGDLGFAGFRLHTHLNASTHKDELVVFHGASYFRALGAGQRYGLSARGLAIDTVGGQGEEFPRFAEFWLVKPEAGAEQVTVYALLDSPSATGAYRFDIRPGLQTVTAVRARIFRRGNVHKSITTLGIAPLTSMFFFGENQPRKEDFRPEVHDSDGLMVATGEGEWLWRPLQNPTQIQVTSFATTNPKGFGLMQRDRLWTSYEDAEARYERRPSAWVRPLHDWGAGRIELVQLPTPDETHDNIVAYWVPAQLPAFGTPLEFAYELSWQGDDLQRPPNAWVTQSRRGFGYTKAKPEALQQIQYVVDFTGPALDALPADAQIKSVASSDANGLILENNTYRNPAAKGWRMTLRVQRIYPDRPVELRAFLQYQNNTVSETWAHILLAE